MSLISKEMILISEENLRKTRDDHKKLKNDYALQQCPFNPGDRVRITGYSHKGKSGVVKVVTAPRHSFYGEWQAQVVVLKKSGEESLNSIEAAEGDIAMEHQS